MSRVYTLSTSVSRFHVVCILLSMAPSAYGKPECCLFQGVTCVYSMFPVSCTLYIVCSAHCNLTMYQWCHACLWQTLVPSCVNTCPHLNNQSFNLSVKSCLFAVSWAPGAPYGTRSTKTVAQCMNRYHDTVVTPWIRSLLFQLTSGLSSLLC